MNHKKSEVKLEKIKKVILSIYAFIYITGFDVRELILAANNKPYSIQKMLDFLFVGTIIAYVISCLYYVLKKNKISIDFMLLMTFLGFCLPGLYMVLSILLAILTWDHL